MSVIRTMLDGVELQRDEPSSTSGWDTGVGGDALAVRKLEVVDPSDCEAILDRFNAHLLSTRVPLDRCVLANDKDTRSYPLEMPANPQELLPSPIPHDEARRLELIEQWGLREIKDLPELELICELAALEMQCPSTLFTIMTRDVQVVLASNLAELKNATFHRDQTCCQHIIMTGQPAALRYLTADVRLQSIPTIKEMNVQFYCGYPIMASDGTILGTMCCFDQKPHGDLTQSQYSHMRELARSASIILEREAKRRLQRRRQPGRAREY